MGGRNHDSPTHKPRNHTLCDIPPILYVCISCNSEGSKKLPEDGRLLPKHVGASIQNKGVVKSVHIVGHFYYSDMGVTTFLFSLYLIEK
jgi:hypothetical protein